ncbi:rhomboid family intramembrane serine protease [Nocardioides sp. GY 10113]|uniref:rhomboid family intramembrane serine protease n=1 Tax=Nocardioides sp. GY 10113 TaxID=2569761 RepID=UPI0010A829EB|nr:rhomboid family intramembrane serine protease [Nocardioides sp. GY 10113]TIC89089.1 rhomboid family intramembrane serine protease [Nocardioides sp. GY 10113]
MTEPTAGVPTCYRHPDRESYIRCQRCGQPICPDCMREAAVGFQCPSCVSEGAKATRAGRTTYGGIRSGKPGSVSVTLIGINVAVWAAILPTGGAGSRLVDLLALRPNGLCQLGPGHFDVARSACLANGGTWLPGVADGAYWQLITSAFAHVQPLHIGFNMLALWFLGPQLEHVLGRARFVALYLVSALAGSVSVFWLSGQYQLTLGASGAVFGLMGALLVIGTKMKADISGLWGWLALNVLITFMPGTNISWQGHVGGLLGGALVAAILVLAPRGPRRGTVQWAGVAGFTALLLAATALRVVQLS